MHRKSENRTTHRPIITNSLTSLLKRVTLVQVVLVMSCLLFLTSSSAYLLNKSDNVENNRASEDQLINGEIREKIGADIANEPKRETPKATTTSPVHHGRSSTPSGSGASRSSNDQWAKKHDEEMRLKAIEDARRRKCDTDMTAAEHKYSVAVDSARAAYNEVMEEWEKVEGLPYWQRHPYDQYAADAKLKHNAISVPAYTEYSGLVSSLKSQGCQIIQLYPNYSW
jgi:hypothetical protein